MKYRPVELFYRRTNSFYSADVINVAPKAQNSIDEESLRQRIGRTSVASWIVRRSRFKFFFLFFFSFFLFSFFQSVDLAIKKFARDEIVISWIVIREICFVRHRFQIMTMVFNRFFS